MHTFEDYIKREILNLVASEKASTPSARITRAKSIGKETPYVTSLRQNQNTYWKTYSRERPQIFIKRKESQSTNKHSENKAAGRSKSTFFQSLLKAEQTLNAKKQVQGTALIKIRKRADTQLTSSTHRRQCLDSHTQARKIEDYVNLQLLKRQSSTASDNYLKAKLQFQKNRPISSSSGGLKLIKI